MAKQPAEVRDRFRIMAELPSEDLGAVIAALTKMGLQNLHYELITDVSKFNRNDHGSTSVEYALPWIAEHPTFRVIELSKHFAEAGRAASTAHYAVKKLIETGQLVKLGEGQYRRSDVMEIAPPPTAERKPGRGTAPQYATSNKSVMLDFLGAKKSFAIADMTAHFIANERPANSATSIVSKLTKDGFFKKLGEGRYEVVKKPKDKPSKLNGAQAGEVAHGS